MLTRRRTLATLVAASAIAGSAPRAPAQDLALVPSASGTRAFADVTVNGVDRGEREIVVLDGDVLIAAADARALAIPGEPSRELAGDAYVSLAAQAPAVRYRFDERDVALSVDVDPRRLPTNRLALAGASPPPELDASRPRSAFANYVLSAGDGGTGGFVEGADSGGNRLLYASGSFGYGEAPQRDATFFAIDDPARMHRTTIGDATFDGDPLVGGASILGAGSRRAFELDPYAYTFATPTIAGAVDSPATADVYVDGVLTRRRALAPGGFALSAIPVSTGPNDVAVVVRDAAGNVQRFDDAFYASPTLLRRGLTDYDYAAGLLRAPVGEAAAYGPPVLAGSYRVGLTDAATLGGRIVAGARSAVAEATADLKIPSGALAIGLAEGAGRAGAGAAVEVAAVVQRGATSLSASYVTHAAGFADVSSLPAVLAPALQQLRFSVGERLGRSLSVTLQAERERYVALPSQSVVQAIASAALDRSTTAVATVGRTMSGAGGVATALAGAAVASATSAGTAPISRTFQFGISLVRAIGRHDTAIATAGDATGASFEHAAPGQTYGTTYDVGATRGVAGTTVGFSATDRLPDADVSTSGVVDGDGLHASATVAGGVVAIDGMVLPSRPVGDGFAVVETGRPNVGIDLDGANVGRTDAAGRLVVGRIAANGINRLGIDPADLALDDEVRTPDRLVSPGARGGSLVALRVATVRYAIGTISLAESDGDALVPADGTLVLRGPAVLRSPLDDAGGFYLENAPPGRYRATVTSGAGDCAFDLVVPAATAVATDLGKRSCAAR